MVNCHNMSVINKLERDSKLVSTLVSDRVVWNDQLYVLISDRCIWNILRMTPKFETRPDQRECTRPEQNLRPDQWIRPKFETMPTGPYQARLKAWLVLMFINIVGDSYLQVFVVSSNWLPVLFILIFPSSVTRQLYIVIFSALKLMS